jgi:hypothetical protein
MDCCLLSERSRCVKIEPFFRWYDLWVGCYVDIENLVIYVCPLPTLGVKLSFGVWEKIEQGFGTLNAFPWYGETRTMTEIVYKLEYLSWDGDWWLGWEKTGPLPQIHGRLG